MRLSLKSKIILITSVILLLFIFFNVLFSTLSFFTEYKSAMESRAYAIGQFLKYQLDRLLKLHIPLKNIVGFEAQCKDIIEKYNDISYAMIVNENGEIIFNNDPQKHGSFITDLNLLENNSTENNENDYYSYRDGEFQNISIPVRDVLNNLIGFVRIGYANKIIEDKTRAAVLNSVFVSVIIIVFSIIILVLSINIWVTKPLTKLLNLINDIRKKGTTAIEMIEVNTKDEIGELSEAFNLMINELMEYHTKINSYTLELENEVNERTSKLDAANRQLQNDLEVLRKAKEDEKRLQDELQRAQKMEAVGTLAAGVAHDLNNILSSIVSYPDLLLLKCTEDDPMRKSLEIIKRAGERAAAIVNDLLTLARRGVSVKIPLDLNRIINEYLKSPEHKNLMLYNKNIKVETELEQTNYPILGSNIHLIKTIMNLVSNAAEAMPDGGVITIKTENRYVDKVIEGFDKILKGRYVVLSISDTGVGIPDENLSRIFEPFYTRKEMGRSGTGLGMAVVWSTVKDLYGYIDVSSKEGEGTEFTLYFPISYKKVEDINKIDTKEILGNGESILVVDDLKLQRDITSEILTKLKYKVFTVKSGEDAVEFIKKQTVDLLILDMIMEPGINGLETYRRVLEINPGQKAIIVSGFSETVDVKEALMLGAGSYVRKPYSLEEIGIAISTELNKEILQ